MNLESPQNGAKGSGQPQTVTTGSNAVRQCLGCLAPAYWQYQWAQQYLPPWVPLGCLSVIGTLDIEYAGDFDYAGCKYTSGTGLGFGLSITPGVINAAAPPATVQITDKPGAFTRISAMPQAQYVDVNGIVEAIGNATTISADGSAISGPTPSLSSAINGRFTGIAGDVSGSSLQVVGAGLVTITGEPQESGTLYTSETTVVQGSFVQTMVTFTWQMQHGSATSTYVRVGSATGYTVGSGASGSSTIPKNVLQGYGSGLYLVDTNTGLTLASASF